MLRVGAPTASEVILRLDLIVKASRCAAPDLGDLQCSGKGKCVTEPSKVSMWNAELAGKQKEKRSSKKKKQEMICLFISEGEMTVFADILTCTLSISEASTSRAV